MTKVLISASGDSDDQLALSLPKGAPRFDRESYFISDANEAAWRCAKAWWASNEPALAICGPSGSGKTHLLHIVATAIDGVVAKTTFWPENETLPACIAFDDLPTGDPKRFLAHLEDLTSAGVRLILAGNGPPAEWAEGLKGLRTRVEAMPRATLQEPDEALMRTVIAKSFRDRQVAVDQRVVDYAAPRLSRTFAAAQAFVTLADELALKKKQKITTTLAQKIINDLSV